MAGLLAAADPFRAVLGAIGLIAATVAVINITAAVAAFAMLAVAYFGATPNLAFAAGLLVALAWLAATTADQSGRRSLIVVHPAFAWLVAGFLAWLALSVVWAPDTGVALQALARYTLVLFIFLAVFAAVRARRDAIVVIGALVFAAAASTLVEVVFVPQSGGRLGGPTADPNTFAAILLPAAILGNALALRPVGLRAGWRFALFSAAGIAVWGVMASESRGAIIAIIVVLVAMPLFAGRWRGRALLLSLSLLALVAVTVAIPQLPLHKTFAVRGLGTSGRSDLWTIAWRMIEDHPLGGVGVGNFRNASVDYLLRPGALNKSQYIVDTPLVAHNSFLQVWAETGTVGLVLFICIVVGSVASAWRAARRFERGHDHGSELIARAALLAMVAMLTSLLFLSYTDYGRPLWILLALGPALLAVSGPATSQSPSPEGDVGVLGGSRPPARRGA